MAAECSQGLQPQPQTYVCDTCTFAVLQIVYYSLCHMRYLSVFIKVIRDRWYPCL
uniref:Uncharacterized protein n=1 Tax=Anguilla anguilla TaxID=7936 RepID=A0A0E9WQ34_ANGAN